MSMEFWQGLVVFWLGWACLWLAFALIIDGTDAGLVSFLAMFALFVFIPSNSDDHLTMEETEIICENLSTVIEDLKETKPDQFEKVFFALKEGIYDPVYKLYLLDIINKIESGVYNKTQEQVFDECRATTIMG